MHWRIVINNIPGILGYLQVDLETLLAKPVEQRGSAGTMVERYKIKYAVLINNAPDLPENLERKVLRNRRDSRH